MLDNIYNYLWFIRTSKHFMQGYNPVVVFFKSLVLGIGFVKSMDQEKKVWSLYEEVDQDD